ncbi:Hypothetical predicted protein [Olea europaea subsp. europaea]|uniref:Uncharacterized protein n=1 Tax=Olea europaea subsp. europaea TaxID=158383 RepID=A0A8S0U990_OLEEU|nr:Hypothetical predicted protein [Olea europaea subsp. europaea]
MASEVADIPQAVNEKVEGEDRKLVNDTTNIVLDNLSKEETMDADVIPNEPQEILNSTFEEENVKNNKEACAVEGEGENFLNLSSTAKVSDEENNSSPDAYEVIEKPDQANKDACKIQSLKDEKLGNRQEEIIATKETSLEEIPQYAEELSINLDKVVDRSVVPVEDTADATSGLKVEDSIHAPDSEDVRIGTSIGETGAEKFVSGRNGKMEENFDVTLEKGSQETITFREDTMDATKNECEFQDPNNSESSFLKDAEDGVIFESNKTMTAPEVSKVGNHSIQTSEKVEANSLKQVDESQIKHEECTQNESRKLSSTAAPTQDIDHEEIEAGDLGKAEISEDERSSENYLPNEKPVESLHVAPEEIKTYASCPSLEQRLCTNPRGILSDETKDKTIDAADKKDVATIDANEEPGGSIPYSSTNDSKVTHQLKKGKENDGPSIDAHHNPVNNRNICSKGGDQINSLDDLDDSKASYEVTEDRSKETKIQVDDDQKMNSKSDIETQMMDEEHDTTIPSEATTDEPIKICQETIELDVTHSSENIEWNKDLKITHPLEDGKDNDGPSMDAPVNNSSNICSKGGGVDQIKSLEDPDDSEASREVKEDQIKEKETQMMKREHDTTTLPEATTDETIKIDQEMNEDQKMTSKHDEIETKLMDREQDTTILSEATINEPINICQETIELGFTHSSENIEWKKDLNITHPLEEGNDGPSIDASVNKSSNMYNKKEGGDQIDSLEDSDDSKGSCEVTKGQSKEIETQVNDDQNMTMEREHNTTTQSKATADETIKIGQEMNDEQKMTNKPDAIETQMMDREHDTTIQSKATADEPITICPKTTELEDTFSSERMEKIIQFDDNRNQHAYVASILEEEVAESFEGEKNRNDIPSQEDVATTDLNVAIGGSIPCNSANDLNAIHPPEEGKDNDGPSIDVPVNDSNNKCSEGRGDWTKGLKDQDYSEASCEATEDQGKEIESQVTDDHKMISELDDIEIPRMDREQNITIRSEATNDKTIKICQDMSDDQKTTSRSDDIEIQMMAKEHDTTILLEAIADEPIKICQETTELEVTHSSENIEMKKDLNITQLLEEGKDNDGPSLDAPVNNSNNMCSEGEVVDQINSLEDLGDSEASRKVTVDQIKETETQVNDDQKMLSKPDDTETWMMEREHDTTTLSQAIADETIEIGQEMNDDQKMISEPNDIEAKMMDRGHDTTVQLETTADESIKVCQETTKLEVTHSSENNEWKKDLNITHQLEERKDDVPSLDAPVNNSSNICNKAGGGNQINRIEDPADFEGSCEVTEGQSTETEIQQDVATADLNEATGGSIPYYRANDLNPLEEGKDNDGPLIDNPVNNSNNKCSEGRGDWINGLEDQDDSEASREVIEYQGKETESQVTDDEKMTSEPDDIETQRMDREQNSTIRSEARNDETIKICQEVDDDQKMNSKPDDIETQIMDMERDTTIQSEATADEAKICHEMTQIEVTYSSENIEKIILLDENRNQHVPVASILEGKNAESFEGDKTITDIPSQQVEVSYQGHDECIGNSAQIIKDSGANENSRVLSAEETETRVLCEEEKKIKEPDTEILERRLRSQDTDLQIMMETDGFTAKLEENSAKESSQDDEGSKESKNAKAELSTREVVNVVAPSSVIEENKLDENQKIDERNETHAALSNCNDQVAAAGNASQNTFNLNLEESYNHSYEEQNLLPVSCNETKDDRSENIEGSSIIPDSSSALKTTENIDIEKAIVGQDGNARNADDFLKENLDTQKATLESKTEHENRMEDLDINSLNSMTEKAMQNLESVEPSKEPPSTSEPVIELKNKRSPESTITTVVNDGIKAMEERNKLIGEVLISQHSLDGTVDTNDDGSEHGADGKQHIDLIQEVVKVYQNDKTTEQEEKVIEQDFESRQREASCEKKIQLGTDDTIDRTPDCDQIITGGSLSEEILQVQQENENTDSEGKIKERIEEEGCPEDVQMIAVADAAMHEEKGVDCSIKNLLSDDSKEKITPDIAEGLNQKQEKSSVTEVPEDEKLVNITSLASIAREENCEYEVFHEPTSFHDKTDTEDVQVLDDSIIFSSKANPVQVDPEEGTELLVPCGQREEPMQQDLITALKEIEEQPRNACEAGYKGKMTLDIDKDLNMRQEEFSVTKESEDEKLANITSLASVATEENSDYKVVHDPSSFHDKTDTEVVKVLDDSITFSLKDIPGPVDPEESTELQVPRGEKVESMQPDPITVLEEIEEEQPRNTSEAVPEENKTLDIHENLDQELEELSDTKVSEDEKLVNITNLASEATEENGDYKIVPETSSFHNKTDVEDVQVLDDAVTISSKENIVQLDPKESTELQVPHGEKVESMQQDPITVLEEIEEQQRSTSEAVSKEKNTLDIIEDLNQEQEESPVTEVPEDKKLANTTRLASVATEENSDCKIVIEPTSFQDRTDTEDVKVLDDCVAFSTGSLVQVDPIENTELQVLCGEKVEAIRQDPITALEEIEEQQPRNASEAVSEARGVIYEGTKKTTDNCEEITDSSSFVELDGISPYNYLQESRKATPQMGEDKGTEKPQDNLHTLVHTKDCPMEMVRKDAQLYVARADGSEDTGVMEKLVAASLLALDKNMVEEEEEFKESEFAENSTTNKNIQQLKQEDTSVTVMTDGKNMKPAVEPQEAKCGQEKITVSETMESRKESTSIEIAKSSPGEFLQIYSMDTSHEEDRSTKEKELYAEKIEPTEDKRAKLQEEKDGEEEACNQKKSAVNVAILEEKGLDSSSIKNLVETNLDECKHKITQEELSLKTMSEEEKPVNMISLASKATEENSESNSFHQKTASKDLQVVEDSITCSNKENIVQIYPKESTDQDPSGEKVELMKQDSVTALEEREEQQTGKSSETISEAKGVNREGEKGITDNCKERVASSSFVPIDEISHSNPLLESRTEVLQDGEEKETESQQNSIHILVHAIDSTLEITPKDAPSCIASADGSDDHPVMQELEVVSPLALDKNVVDEANYEETSHVEDHSTNKEELQEERTEPTEDKEAKAEEDEAGKSKRSDFGSQALILVEERDKDAIGSVSEAPFEDLKVEGEANKFTDKADTAPSTVTKKEMNVEEICENEKSTNSHDETPEITNATSDDLGGQEVESARVAETAASVPQSETVEAHNADIGIAVVEQSESGEIEIADEENESEAVYKSNDQNIEELISLEFPNLTKNDAENNEKETDKDYEKGFETKCERAEAVIEDNITSDQGKEELPEKPLELLSKVQLFDNKPQSTENNDHGENEEGMEHGEEASKDEDNSINSTKKEEVDNVVDSNIEILQPDKLEKALESETQVRSIEVIPKGGQTKTEEENLEAAKEEMGNVEIVAEEICEAKESKINISSEQTKDEAKAVEDFPLGFPNEEIIPERYQEGEEKPEEYLKVKTEEAVKSATEKVSGKFEQAFVKENVSEHIVFDNKAVEEPKESIVGIFQVKEEGKIAEGIATIVNNQEKGHELDDVYVETEREVLSEEVKISGVAFLKHGEDRTGANEDTGLQNKNFNFSPKGDAAAGELLDNENIISEAAPTKLIRETIEDNKEIIMKEKESIERKDEKPSITESLGDGEIEERQNKNQHESETDEQLNDEVCISNRVQENDEEQVVLLAGEGEVIADEADSCSRQIKDGNEKPDFSSHSTDPSEISHSNGALGIAKDNENSTDLRMLEKIFTGTTESEISELTCPNESEETITSPGSKDIQSMEQVSETIAVDAEMHDSNAGTASSDVQEATGVKSREEEKEEDDYKKMKETSTSTECAIPTSKIKQGYAVETLVVVEDQETEDKLVELHHFPHLHHIQDSEGKTEEDGPVDLQRARNITEDMQELDERSIALSNKENLAETDPNESKEHEVSSRGKGLALIQQDPVPATFQEEIDDQQPGNSSEAVSEVKDAICEEEKVTITNCNEFTENNSCVTSDKVSPSNMLQGSASEAAQGTKDKNTPTQCHELPLSSDIKSSDMERTQMDVESWVETVDDINVTNAMQNLDAASVPASDKLTVIDAYHTKNVEFFNSTVDNKYMTQLQQDTAEIFQAEGKIPTPSELEQEERTADETIESTKKSVSTEIAKASLPYILQGSLKESSEMADHRTEGREPTVQKEELKAEKTEEAEDKEEKCDEEKDSHEESREQKGSDLSFEAPVPVDAGDVHTKVSHKKSHNILSGVGSKVKHSIAKVKKAITGKSSQPKPPSPKESKKC